MTKYENGFLIEKKVDVACVLPLVSLSEGIGAPQRAL